MSTAGLKNPWPGPRPYEESEWGGYRGRLEDIIKIRQRIAAARLTVITGPSGCGKTSLLRGGVVPALRFRRYKQPDLGEPPVVLLRDWGVGSGEVQSSFDRLIAAKIEQSVHTAITDVSGRVAESGMRWWGRTYEQARHDEGEILNAARSGASALAQIQRIADKGGGLTLVLDQLEELLRANREVRQNLIDWIIALYQGEATVHTVLSIRPEHIADLHSLEGAVGGLMSRTVIISELTTKGGKDLLQSVANNAGFKPDGEVIDTILDWRLERHTETKAAEAEALPLDLVAAQAVLHGLFDHAIEKKTDRIDAGLLGEFMARMEGGGSVAADSEPRTPAWAALQAWIDQQIGSATDVKLEEINGAIGELSEEARQALRDWVDDRLGSVASTGDLLKRIAVRLAPHLSSGSFKLPQAEDDLFIKSIGDDLMSLLNVSVAGLKEQYAGGALQPIRTAKSTADLAAGAALRGRWSAGAIAEIMKWSFGRALEVLQAANIIKPILHEAGRGGGAAKRRVWELVHDRVGGAFAHWGDVRRNTWRDCAASLVASQGVSPIRVHGDRLGGKAELTDFGWLNWRGCIIQPIAGERVELSSIDFRSCSLKGTVFRKCVLRKCSFTDCNLDGTLFIGCEFDECSFNWTKRPTERLTSLGIILSTIGDGGMTVDGVEVMQLSVCSVKLRGRLLFGADCTVRLSLFEGITREKDGAVFFDPGCDVRGCSVDSRDTAQVMQGVEVSEEIGALERMTVFGKARTVQPS